MKKIVEELKQLISFKETTDIGDTVLIVAKEPQMLAYAHIDDIKRDTGRKTNGGMYLSPCCQFPYKKRSGPCGLSR